MTEARCRSSLQKVFPDLSDLKELVMLYAAVLFVIAIIAGVFGFGGITVGAAEIARIPFFVFLAIFLWTAVS
jgi:uncharacterized membrane protein YtjA (UPF0391 family)